MSNPLKLHGIVPSVVTPYNADGSIDTTSLRRVIRHLVDGGVHGLFMLGTTSECAPPWPSCAGAASPAA